MNPVEEECQFPVSVEVNQNANAKTDIDSLMPVSEVSPVFNPSCVLDIQHEEEKGDDDEEYRLFGTPSNSPRSSNDAIDSDDGEDEMDDDAGTLFKPLFNVEALNFFVNNEMDNCENVVDYSDENFGGTLLEDKCLLVSMHVHYTYLTQSNNLKRKMKEKKWLGKVVRKKLINIKEKLSNKFGENVKGRGHWEEIEFIRLMLVRNFATNFNIAVGSSQPMMNLTRSNCNTNLNTFPAYNLRYVNKGTKSYIEKVFPCGNNSIFFKRSPMCIVNMSVLSPPPPPPPPDTN